jgi:glucosylceramidase
MPAWRVVLSTRDGARPAPQPAVAAAAGGGDLPRLWVDAGRRFQTVMGFGGAFTEAAAVTWQALPAAERDALLRAYFDPAHGHGYTLGRVHMGSCDFALGHYAHADVPGDLDLRHFDIARDRQHLLPFIKAAQRIAGRPLTLLASPWSPPAWMKDNGQMAHGGRLKPECRAAWAQCFVRFIQAYADEGVPIWGVTLQNEPLAVQRWDSCIWSAEEERDFVRDHLGPALDAAGLGHVKILGWDHNRDGMVERASVLYGDPEAARRFWGLAFHWYGEPHFDHVRQVHEAWPDKALLFTEGCQEGGPHPDSWAAAERYALALIHDLNRGTVGWIDWNLLLDETGGPNHVGNLCHAPVLVDRAAQRWLPQPAFHVLGHFARSVAPGARRVLCAATREALACTAFANPDGSLAVIAFNGGDAPLPFLLCGHGPAQRIELPPHAIVSATAGGTPLP